MTAAIMTNQLASGFTCHYRRSCIELAYMLDPTSQQQVQRSDLLAGEYNNSIVRVGM